MSNLHRINNLYVPALRILYDITVSKLHSQEHLHGWERNNCCSHKREFVGRIEFVPRGVFVISFDAYLQNYFRIILSSIFKSKFSCFVFASQFIGNLKQYLQVRISACKWPPFSLHVQNFSELDFRVTVTDKK